MPYQTIVKTDGLVDGLDTFVVFREVAHAKRPQRDQMYEKVDLNAFSFAFVTLSLIPSNADRPIYPRPTPERVC